MTTNNGAGGLVAKWRAEAARLPEGDWAEAHKACALELEAALQAQGEAPPPSDVLRRVVEAAQLLADLMPDAELETDAVQGEIVESLREALAAHKALAQGVERG